MKTIKLTEKQYRACKYRGTKEQYRKELLYAYLNTDEDIIDDEFINYGIYDHYSDNLWHRVSDFSLLLQREEFKDILPRAER